MRVLVNWNLCESNALCMGVAPEVFEVGEDDELSLLMEEPPEHLRTKVQQAAASCPKGAITLLD
jgi:ferredoxin